LKIFVSYSRDDAAFVAPLRADLAQLGHDVWMDQRLLGGQEWWDEILANIRECDLFVLALSPKSIESDACLLEVRYARAVRRLFLPVMVLTTDPNFFPPEVAHAQFVDYTRSDDRSSLLHLVSSITQLPPAPPLPDPLAEPPAIPQGPLYEVRRLIALATELDRKHQLWLLDMLEQNSLNPRLRADVTGLLTEFRRRQDLMADISAKVDELLRSLQGDRRAGPEISPARRRAWIPVLIIGITLSAFAALEFPSTDKGASYYESFMDFIIFPVIYVVALRRAPRFAGWWFIFAGFVLDCAWYVFQPFLEHRYGTVNLVLGGGGPLVLVIIGMLMFRPPWQTGRRSGRDALIVIVVMVLAAIASVKTMPAGWELTSIGYALTLASVLFVGVGLWVGLERGLTPWLRIGVIAAGLSAFINATFVTHVTTGTVTTWMEWPWHVAGFILASIAVFAAARWPAAQWPIPVSRAKTGNPPAVAAT
jgi:TIR domain